MLRLLLLAKLSTVQSLNILSLSFDSRQLAFTEAGRLPRWLTRALAQFYNWVLP